MDKLSYLILRLGVGLSLFGHGLVRLPKLQAFSAWMVTSFEKSMLPKLLVIAFSYALPIIEFTVGLLLIFGMLTKQAILVAALSLLALILGTTLIENWDALPSQLIHIGFLALLFQFMSSNAYSLDGAIGNTSKS